MASELDLAADIEEDLESLVRRAGRLSLRGGLGSQMIGETGWGASPRITPKHEENLTKEQELRLRCINHLVHVLYDMFEETLAEARMVPSKG